MSMKALKSFTINFSSLSDGEHLFDYQIDSKFLKHFEAALVQEADLKVQLRLVKFIHSLELHYQLSGTVATTCDICAGDLDLPVEGEELITVKIVRTIPKDADEYNVVYIQEGQHSLYLGDMIYELVMLSIPMRTVHPLDEDGNSTCDPAVLEYLNQSLEASEEDEQEDEGGGSSVWDALKKLK